MSSPEQIKILVADDEDRIRKIISDFLTREGYTVIEASNGAQALNLCSAQSESDRPDLIILDIMMPVMDGLTVLEELRRTTDIPVILLTAKTSENDQLGGFRMGADDYITKPFSPNLLVVRVQAILRRRGKIGSKRIQCGNVHIDEMAHAAYLDSEQLELTPKEYDLLLYFIENKGIALSREKILNGVWNYDYFGDLRTVDTHVKQLRAKLKESGDMIVTVRGVGYRLEVR